jgi:hypothetical protein
VPSGEGNVKKYCILMECNFSTLLGKTPSLGLKFSEIRMENIVQAEQGKILCILSYWARNEP